MLKMPVLPQIPLPFFLRSIFVFFALASNFSIKAQLCSGSLGDPVVNITFGSGGNNSGYTATNAYLYTITNSTANCFGNTWHTVSSDHTGNGAFLLVNATLTPGDFFVTTVNNL